MPKTPFLANSVCNEIAVLTSTRPYYLASGKEDVERRQTYAQEIAKQFAAIHREEVHFKYEAFSDADHLTTIPRALPAALEYIFSRYKDYAYANTQQKLIPWFGALNSQRERVYGVGIANNSSNAAYFMDLTVEQKDLAALDHFAGYFLTPDSDVSLWFNAAQYYRSLAAIPKAKALYSKAIVKAKKTKRTDFGILAYRCLSLNVYSEVEQNPAMAWKTLLEGRDALKDIVFNYFLGLVATRHNYNLDEGIQYLLDFERERNESLFGRLYPLDQVEALLANAYWLKGNTAEASGHVEKALQLNPANPEAQALKKTSPKSRY